MKQIRLYLIVFIVFAFGLVIVGFTTWRKEKVNAAIAAIELIDECKESETTNDFADFWSQFRAAVRSADKHKLFSMTRVCRFSWEVLTRNEELVVPLAHSVDALRLDSSTPFRVNPRVNVGGLVVFETEEDFLANYKVIFSDRIYRRILYNNPIIVTDGVYEITWRDDGLRHLRFEHADKTGYKFAGLQWEP